MPSDLLQPITHKLAALDIKPTARAMIVSISEQTLTLVEDGRAARVYTVSTSKNPPSCAQDSGGTPFGLHRVAEKIGADAPLGAVFKGRVPIGKTYPELSAAEQTPNLITTRILWLEGLETGVNRGPGCDSRERYIYVHGTNHEDKIGTPASGGCIQLLNADMADLFDRAQTGDLIHIS